MIPARATLLSLLTALAASSPLSSRADNTGLHWAPDHGCSDDQMNTVNNAIKDTQTLSQRALSALQSPKQNPAAYFFPSSYSSTAEGVFNAVLAALSPDSSSGMNPIQLFCRDVSSLCASPAPDNSGGMTAPRLGYVPDDANPAPGRGTAQIVMCPPIFELPRTPAPCSGQADLANLGWGFLRTFVTLRSVQVGFSRLGRDAIVDSKPGAHAAHSLLSAGADRNADNYAQLATMSNDLGVENTSVQCSNAWPADLA